MIGVGGDEGLAGGGGPAVDAAVVHEEEERAVVLDGEAAEEGAVVGAVAEELGGAGFGVEGVEAAEGDVAPVELAVGGVPEGVFADAAVRVCGYLGGGGGRVLWAVHFD